MQWIIKILLLCQTFKKKKPLKKGKTSNINETELNDFLGEIDEIIKSDEENNLQLPSLRKSRSDTDDDKANATPKKTPRRDSDANALKNKGKNKKIGSNRVFPIDHDEKRRNSESTNKKNQKIKPSEIKSDRSSHLSDARTVDNLIKDPNYAKNANILSIDYAKNQDIKLKQALVSLTKNENLNNAVQKKNKDGRAEPIKNIKGNSNNTKAFEGKNLQNKDSANSEANPIYGKIMAGNFEISDDDDVEKIKHIVLNQKKESN